MIEVHILNSLNIFYIMFLLIQMGEKLMAGRGVPQNNSQAMQWFRWHLHFQILISEVLFKSFQRFHFCPASFILSQHNPMKLSLLLRATFCCCFELFFDNISLNFVPVRLQKKTHICLSLIAFGFIFSPGRRQIKVIHMRSTTLPLLISTGMTLAWKR